MARRRCDGTWIKQYIRSDGSKVEGHCRTSIVTAMAAAKKNTRELKAILKVSTESLRSIESKLDDLKNPVSLTDLRQQIDSLLQMSIPTSSNTPMALQDLLKDHIRELKEHHARAKSETDTRNATHPDIIALKDDMRKIEAQLNVIQDFMRKLEPLTKPSTLSTKSIELDSVSETLSKTSALCDDITARNTDLESRLKDATTTITSLQDRIKTLGDNPKQMEQNRELDKQLITLRDEMNALRSRQSECEDAKSRLQGTVDEKIRAVDQANSRMREKEEELSRVQQQVISSESSLKRIMAEKEALQGELDQVKERESKLNTDIDRFQLELNTEKQRLNMELHKKEENLSKAAGELDRMRQNVATLEETKRQLEMDKTSVTQELTRVREELERTKKDQIDALDNVSSLQRQLTEKTVSLTRELGECKTELTRIEDENHSIKSKESKLDEANRLLQSKIVELTKTIDDLHTQLRTISELKTQQTVLVTKAQEDIVSKLTSDKTTLEKEIDELRKKHEIELRKEQSVCNSKIAELNELISSRDETLRIKTVELEMLQEKYTMELKQRNAPVEDVQTQLQETGASILQRVTELEKQLELDKALIDQYKITLDEKDKELDQLRTTVSDTKRALESTQHAYKESITLLRSATDILDQSPLFKGIADQFKKNMDLLRSSQPIHPIEYKADETKYDYQAPEPESFDVIYQEYERILTELKQVQTYYVKLVTSVGLVNQQNAKSQDDNPSTLIVYSFLTTALFHLTKTYLRLPSVLRMLSIPTVALSSEENSMLRDNLLNAFFVNKAGWFERDHPINSLLRSINPELYELYHHTIEKHQSRVRIDILSYYLMQFVYIIRNTERSSSEYNIFLRMIDSLSQIIMTNLKTIMYSTIGDTKHKLSALDTIQYQEYRSLRSTHNESNGVVTFVKLRVDGDIPTDINRRFTCNILTGRDTDDIYQRRVLHVGYSDFDYRKDFGEDAFGNAEFATNGFPFYTDNEEPTCNLDLIKHNHDFYFGPFTQVYTADQSALDITRDKYFIEGVEKKLRDGKPACIIGYGGSGSGKTSTLVYLSYYKNGQIITQDGILAELSNKLADTYNQSCRIQVYEFEGNIAPGSDQDAISNYHVRKFPAPVESLLNDAGQPVKVYTTYAETDRDKMYPNDAQGTCFEYKIGSIDGKQQWVKSDTKRFTKMPITEQAYQMLPKDQRAIHNGIFYKLVPDLDTSGRVVPMAKDIADFMDNKRNIAATTNNPVSSRSHVVIFITYTSPTKTVTLVLCDFAGVENRFDCSSESVLSKLATIPTKATANKPPSEQTPFYQEQMGLIKQEKFKQFDRQHGAVLREQAKGVSDNVFRNIDYLLIKMQSTPLTNIQSKSAEAMFQALYPPSQMVNLTIFLERLKRVYTLYDTLSKSPVSSTIISGKPISTLLKAGGYVKTELSASTETFKTLKKTHNIDITRLADPGTGYKIAMNEIMPIDENPAITNKLIWLSANYAKELFATYKSDAERDAALLVWQYYLECMINVPNPVYSESAYPVSVDGVNSQFLGSVCDARVKEGLYINNSLKMLRQFIGQLVQSTSKGYAPFIDACLPLQCNPFYKECFGINEYDPKIRSAEKGSLAEQIMKVPNAKDMTFCIMCVVNLSKKANNPPPSPYIDITPLLTEYERLKAVEQQFFMKRKITQKYIEEKIQNEFDGALMSNAFVVNPTVIKALMSHPLLTRPISPDIQATVKRYGAYLLEKTVHDGYYLKTLSDLVEVLNNSNAITTIGTLQFTDTMAKFGTNTMTCNIAASVERKESTDPKQMIESITLAGAKKIYEGLSNLVQKGVLTSEEFLKQYKPFERQYKPPPQKK